MDRRTAIANLSSLASSGFDACSAIAQAAMRASTSSSAINLGGSATALLNDRVRLRGDVRCFRGIRNDDATAAADALEVSELKFLRFAVSVTVKFCLRIRRVGGNGMAVSSSGENGPTRPSVRQQSAVVWHCASRAPRARDERLHQQ